MTFPPLTEIAPARINLYLHITGQNFDKSLKFDSLEVFTGTGDEIRLDPQFGFSVEVDGPQAAPLQQMPMDDNWVFRAAMTLSDVTHKTPAAKLTLTKNLPIDSGIGTRAGDAAATLRILGRHWGMDYREARIYKAASELGKDVPASVDLVNHYMTAEGVLAAKYTVPDTYIVLVNPNKPLPATDVFQAYCDAGPNFSAVSRLDLSPPDIDTLVRELKLRKNDLTAAACRLLPDLSEILHALTATKGCRLARMSGSGPTCFGIYNSPAEAAGAAQVLQQQRPDWWAMPTRFPCVKHKTPSYDI